MPLEQPVSEQPASRTFSRRDILLVGAAFLITVSSGILYSAIISGRLLPGRTATQDELDKIPAQIGAFELERAEELNEVATRLLQVDAYINRIYVDHGSGQVMHLLLLAGPSVPLTAHTPDVCYATQTYDVGRNEETLEVPVGEQVHQFRVLRLRSRVPTEPGLQVIYGWNAGKTWICPALAKVRLTGYERLLKLQVALPIQRSREISLDECRKIMSQLLEVLPK
ncbi:MAG: hypothetical protein KatS3mg109_1738 [Pirellulaceae bacterium]|nr:MAG: hypothetical protein KatS3mg109_1738 [Pirellulaceae bacterium]